MEFGSMSELENLLQHEWPVSRVNQRRGVETPLQLTCRCGSVSGSCIDLSLGGIGFTAPAEFKPGEQVDVEFSLPPSSDHVFTTSVIIRWTDGSRHGGEFLKPTSDLLRDLTRFVSAPAKKSPKSNRLKQH
jgi:PilZ domain-containing protein